MQGSQMQIYYVGNIYLVDSILKFIDCLLNTKIRYLVSDNDAMAFGNFRTFP